MTLIDISEAQKNIYGLISDVNDSSVPVVIVNDLGKNTVLNSEDDRNCIQILILEWSRALSKPEKKIPGIVRNMLRMRNGNESRRVQQAS